MMFKIADYYAMMPLFTLLLIISSPIAMLITPSLPPFR